MCTLAQENRLSSASVTTNLQASEQVALDVTLRRAIGPATALTGLAYGVSALAHAYAGGVDRTIVAPVEGFSFVALGSLGLWLRGREREVRQTHVLLVVWAGFVLLNNLVFLGIHDDVQHPAVLYLLALGVGVVSGLPRPMYFGILAATFAVYGATILRADTSLAQRVEPGLVLVAATCFSIALRSWVREHLAQVRRLSDESLRNARAHDAAVEHHREITEMATVLIAELDEYGTVLYANPAHEVVFGYEPAAIVGRQFGHLMSETAIGRKRELLEGMLNEPVGPIRLGITHSSGEQRVIESSSRPYRTLRGERRLVVTGHDVTAQVNLETERANYRTELESLVEERTEALRRSMLELQRRERLAAVGTLAAGIAHQINNPVGSMRMSAEFALGTAPNSEDEVSILREALASNVDEAKRCGEIVKNLLRFARDECAETTQVEMGALLERVVALCISYAVSRHAVLSHEPCAIDTVVMGNAVELEQAVINLIRNAIESSSDKVHVQVSLERDADCAVVEVRDNGDGMNEEQVGQVFDPFFTTRLVDGGTGLGLSVAHGIATAHGGTLTAQSEQGVGTRMRLTLPLHRTRVKASAPPAPPPL